MLFFLYVILFTILKVTGVIAWSWWWLLVGLFLDSLVDNIYFFYIYVRYGKEALKKKKKELNKQTEEYIKKIQRLLNTQTKYQRTNKKNKVIRQKIYKNRY